MVDIYKERESKTQRTSPVSLKESQNLLIKLISANPETIICIDALGEVDSASRIDLLKSLKQLIEKSNKRVKIFATTRNDTNILHQLKIFPRIDIEVVDNFNDISMFIFTTVESACILDGQLLDGNVSDQLKDEICNVLCDRSNGM